MFGHRNSTPGSKTQCMRGKALLNLDAKSTAFNQLRPAEPPGQPALGSGSERFHHDVFTLLMTRKIRTLCTQHECVHCMCVRMYLLFT